MAKYNTSEFKAGLKVLLDGVPMEMVSNEFVKPGKGQGFSRTKLKNLYTGKVIEKTFKSGESIDAADVEEVEANFSYFDGEFYVFMHPETFEMYNATEQAVGEAKQWLKEQASCDVILFNGQPIAIEPPSFIHATVKETDPGVKGDTAGTGGKPAIIDTGAKINVPLFIQEGEQIKVDTRTGEYAGRVK